LILAVFKHTPHFFRTMSQFRKRKVRLQEEQFN
jgi:hypothetical protein